MQDLIQAIETQSKGVTILGVYVDLRDIKTLPKNRKERTKFVDKKAKELYQAIINL